MEWGWEGGLGKAGERMELLTSERMGRSQNSGSPACPLDCWVQVSRYAAYSS